MAKEILNIFLQELNNKAIIDSINFLIEKQKNARELTFNRMLKKLSIQSLNPITTSGLQQLQNKQLKQQAKTKNKKNYQK